MQLENMFTSLLVKKNIKRNSVFENEPRCMFFVIANKTERLTVSAMASYTLFWSLLIIKIVQEMFLRS